jgi:hypothetical protein
MSDWDRIIADLHDVEDIDRAVAACDALDQAADESWLPRLHELLENGRDFSSVRQPRGSSCAACVRAVLRTEAKRLY